MIRSMGIIATKILYSLHVGAMAHPGFPLPGFGMGWFIANESHLQ